MQQVVGWKRSGDRDGEESGEDMEGEEFPSFSETEVFLENFRQFLCSRHGKKRSAASSRQYSGEVRFF